MKCWLKVLKPAECGGSHFLTNSDMKTVNMQHLEPREYSTKAA